MSDMNKMGCSFSADAAAVATKTTTTSKYSGSGVGSVTGFRHGGGGGRSSSGTSRNVVERSTTPLRSVSGSPTSIPPQRFVEVEEDFLQVQPHQHHLHHEGGILMADVPAPGSTAAPTMESSENLVMLEEPTEIPPEPADKNGLNVHVDGAQVEEDDDVEEEDDEEYEYEDDDDAPFVSGFLMGTSPALVTTVVSSMNTTRVILEEANAAAPATIRDEEEPSSFSSSSSSSNPCSDPATTAASSNDVAAIANPSAASAPTNAMDATLDQKQKWRQPSKAAVNMSLRAEQETTGGKRRLAQDLYRIMNQDTEEAGFSLQPTTEDSMDKWTIRLFKFDEDSNLAKDMLVLGLTSIELEMSFPDQYPFEPPFVRVVRPRFKRQTGFVMNGALCMELLTKDGWNPVNDIESVIVSIRSLLVVGDGRLEKAKDLSESKYKALLAAAQSKAASIGESTSSNEGATDLDDDSNAKNPAIKRQRMNSMGDAAATAKAASNASEQERRLVRDTGGSYSISEAESAYTHLSDYHKKKGWDSSGWWARKG